MSDVVRYLNKALAEFMDKNKLESAINKIRSHLLLKAKYVSEREELEKTLHDQMEQTNTLLDYLSKTNHHLQHQSAVIRDLQNQGINRDQTWSSSSSSDSQSEKTEQQELDSGETHVKELKVKIEGKANELSRKQEDMGQITMRINRIKSQLNLSEDATMEQVEIKISELKKKSQQEAQSLQERLNQAKQQHNQLSDAIEELKQEKKFLEIKLRNKETTLRRMKTFREAKKFVGPTSCAHPTSARQAGGGFGSYPFEVKPVALSARPTTSMDNLGGRDIGLQGPNTVESPEICPKCCCPLANTVYCNDCVQTVLYNGKSK